jgi:hypothetical protein
MKEPTADVLELPVHVRATMALKETVREALEDHARAGRPAYIWRDGKVVEQLKAVDYEHVISIEHESPFTSARVGVAKSAEALEEVLLDRAQIFS